MLHTNYRALDGSSEGEGKVQVSKIDAARRQLDCAIELWFNEGDEVSIFTLSGAAYQILHDIHLKTETAFPGLLYNTDWIKEEHWKDWNAIFKKPLNFSKHADHDPDPDGLMEFNPDTVFALMYASLAALNALRRPLSCEQEALKLWIVFHYPSWITEQHREMLLQNIPIAEREAARHVPRQDFLKGFREAWARRGR